MVKILEAQFAGNTIPVGSVRHILNTLQKASGVLGLPEIFPSTRDLFVPPDVTEMAQRRQQARSEGNWAKRRIV